MSEKNEKEIDIAVEKANETNLIIRIFVWAMMLIILGCFIYSMYESDVKYKQAKSLQSHAERCTVYHIKAPENSVYTCKGD